MSFDAAIDAFEKKDFSKSLELFAKVKDQDPENVSAWLGYALSADNKGDLVTAIAGYKQTVHLKPDFMEAWSNLGLALKNSKAPFKEIEQCYQKALALDPKNPEILFNLGNLYLAEEKFSKAIVLYEEALEIHPDHVLLQQNLAEAYKGIDLEKALAIATALYERQSNNPEIQFSLSLLQLACGHFEEGFRNFKARRNLPDLAPRHLDIAHWQAESLKGKTLLVHAEQGLGDSIMMLRFLPKLYEQGGKVIVQCSKLIEPLIPPHKSLLKITTNEEVVEHVDYQIPMLGLPEMFIKQESDLKGAAYLKADPKKDLKGAFKVGLVWAGNPDHKNDHNRSCGLNALLPLLDVEGCTFYGLQVGEGAQQLTPEMQIEDLGKSLKTFKDTAQAIAALDLVISIDSAVGHLAGALGIKTWLMISQVGCDWRWQRNRVDSPWYESVALYRQKQSGDWESVVKKMKADLEAIIS